MDRGRSDLGPAYHAASQAQDSGLRSRSKPVQLGEAGRFAFSTDVLSSDRGKGAAPAVRALSGQLNFELRRPAQETAEPGSALPPSEFSERFVRDRSADRVVLYSVGVPSRDENAGASRVRLSWRQRHGVAGFACLANPTFRTVGERKARQTGMVRSRPTAAPRSSPALASPFTNPPFRAILPRTTRSASRDPVEPGPA